MSKLRRRLTAVFSLLSSLCILASTLYKDAALPLWLFGFASIITALFIATRSKAAPPQEGPTSSPPRSG